LTRRKVLWLITARSGSKSIPDKNIKRLGGVPLLAYRVTSALAIAAPEDVWVSTNRRRYAKIAESFGAQAPFLRPKHLSSDRAKSSDAVFHAMRHAASLGRKYDAIGLLEPTSPFVTSAHLLEAVDRLFEDKKAQGIVAVHAVRPSTFYVQPDARYLSRIARRMRKKGELRRQDERSEITPSGGFYISKWDFFWRRKTFYSERTLAFHLSETEGLEIDELIDWSWADFLIERKLVSVHRRAGRIR